MSNDVNLIKKGLEQRRKQRAQSLTEFALILPVLLFFIMGIIDFGRVLFTYAQASAAIRAALRYASVVGYSTPVYLDCDLMRTAASSMFFDQGTPTVNIDFRKAATWNGTTFTTIYPNDGNCQGSSTTNDLTTIQRNDLKNGDILRISANISVAMMTPFFPSPLTFTLAGQRTLVTNVSLVDSPYILEGPSAATQTADMQTFVARLSTQSAQTAQAVAGQTNTAIAITQTIEFMLTNGIDTPTHTATLDVTATPTYTPALPQVTGLTWWSGGAKCYGNPLKQRPALIWDKLTGVQGYYIYADGVLVGQTMDSKGKIRQCGRSLSTSRVNRISGCFNLDASTYVDDDLIQYQVAAFTGGGAVIGPPSDIFEASC